MKKLLLLIIPLLFSCQKNIKNIDFNTIKDPCELVDVGIMICNEGLELRESIRNTNRNELSKKQRKKIYFQSEEKKDEFIDAWFNGYLECVYKNRWNDDIRYCEKYNELMRLQGLLDYHYDNPTLR